MSTSDSLRRLLPWTTAILLVALLWTGWIFFSRYRDARALERRNAAKEVESDREILNRLGGDKLTILNFYVSPAAAHRGEHVSLCYGVSNAASVAIEPDLGQWKPALSRCIDVAPKHSTDYTLTARNTKGDTITANATVTVK